jgi:tetratricopeptide (TPR) repeat protein
MKFSYAPFFAGLPLFTMLFLFSGVSPVRAAEPPPSGQVADPHSQMPSQLSLEQLRQTYAANPYHPVIKKNLATAVMMHGIGLLKQKRYEEAAAQFEYAEELFPDDPQAAFLRGNAVYQLKQYDLARTELEKSRNLGGDSVDVLFFLGKVFYDTEDIREAVTLWELAAQKDPENKTLQELLAKAKRELSVDAGMGKGQSSRFILSYDSGIKSDAADKVLDVLEDAYNQVGRDFGAYPESRVPVILYTGKDYREITGSPGWSGGQYDGKIRLPVGGMTEVTPVVRSVLFHEYTHVVVRELTKGNCPVWLNEGLAEIEGRREFDPPLTALKQAATGNALLSLSSLTGSFASLQGKSVDLAYQQSYSLVRYMTSTYGWHTIKELLTALGEGATFDTAAARAYRGAGRTFPEIAAEWRDQTVAGQGQ